MKLFTDKSAAMASIVCVATLIGLAGCAVGDTSSTKDATAQSGGKVMIMELEKSWGPSYEQDDPALVYGVVSHTPEVELRWGPSYTEDDPGLVGIINSASQPAQ